MAKMSVMHIMAILALIATMAIIPISTVMAATSKFFFIGCYDISRSYGEIGCNRHHSCNGHNNCNTELAAMVIMV